MQFHHIRCYNQNPQSLPGKHQNGAVPLDEIHSSDFKSLSKRLFKVEIMFFVLLYIPYYIYTWDDMIDSNIYQIVLFVLLTMLSMIIKYLSCILFYHDDIYICTNLKKLSLLIYSTDTMSKTRFILMNSLPVILLGLIPYILGYIYPTHMLLAFVGIFNISTSIVDICRVYQAITKVPKGAKVYCYQLNYYWYKNSFY